MKTALHPTNTKSTAWADIVREVFLADLAHSHNGVVLVSHRLGFFRAGLGFEKFMKTARHPTNTKSTAWADIVREVFLADLAHSHNGVVLVSHRLGSFGPVSASNMSIA